MNQKNEIVNKLRSSKLRPTKQRKRIAEFLFNRENIDAGIFFIIISKILPRLFGLYSRIYLSFFKSCTF